MKIVVSRCQRNHHLLTIDQFFVATHTLTSGVFVVFIMPCIAVISFPYGRTSFCKKKWFNWGHFLSKCCQFVVDLEPINHFEDAQDRQKVPNCQEFCKAASVALMKDFLTNRSLFDSKYKYEIKVWKTWFFPFRYVRLRLVVIEESKKVSTIVTLLNNPSPPLCVSINHNIHNQNFNFKFKVNLNLNSNLNQNFNLKLKLILKLKLNLLHPRLPSLSACQQNLQVFRLTFYILHLLSSPPFLFPLPLCIV